MPTAGFVDTCVIRRATSWTSIGSTDVGFARVSDCSVDGCVNPRTGREYCSAHRMRLRRTGSVEGERPLRAHGGGTCQDDGCHRPIHTLGYCNTHSKAMTKYKLPREEVTRLQSAPCGACGAAPYGRGNCIDHDHATGAVRGSLCSNCNLALGLLGDSVERIDGLRRYLVG